MAAEAETGQERRIGVDAEPGCFLCPLGDHGCDVGSVEGHILRVVPGARRQSPPHLLLLRADGATISLTLPEHVNPIATLLATLTGAALRSLRARVYHLMHTAAPPAGGQDTAAQHVYRATPASALVVEPDLLLNITDINNAEYCVRQYPLRRMAPSPPNAATLRGTIIHGAFKEMLKGTPDSVEGHLRRALDAHLDDIALRQLPYDELSADAEPHLRALSTWRESERANLWNLAPRIRAETFLLAPEVGLKGRLDFLMQDEQGGTLLELKTGRATHGLPKREHRWQVYGYQTLLAARRPGDAQQPSATLLYSGTPGRAEGYGIPFQPRELHRVLELRNRLAILHATGAAPAPPGPAKCARCALRAECLRASALLGWEAPESEEPVETPVDATDAAWFARYYELLRLEARAVEEQSRALWRLTPEERAAAGLALGGLVPVSEPRQTENGEWQYEFRCENTSELREGDEILLSDGDPIRGAIVSGSILRLTAEGVTVWTPERIANPVLLDRYESDIVHNRTVRNLWRWLDAEPRMRALVSGQRAPRFAEPPALDDLAGSFNAEQREAIARALATEDFLLVQGPPGTGKTAVVAEIARRAMARGERVLVAAFTNQAVDNVLARLRAVGCENFVRLGHELSVAPALRAYRLTERAHRRAASGPRADTTGDEAALSGVAAQQDVAPEAFEEGRLTPEVVRETLSAAPLVAATTATWSAERYDDVGDMLRFDLAIVDEASQLTVPALLGALRFARRFVLVGDERQLPPLVVSEDAAEQGLKRSLFAELLERWGSEACVGLRHQYRMHPDICAFPSRAFYGGRLEAAGAARTAQLDVGVAPRDPLYPVLAPERPVVFVHVPESTGGAEGKVSAGQAHVVTKIVRALLAAGVPAAEIGCIAPYRAQVAAVRQRLAASGIADVTVDTVDRFQGGERRTVIFSFGGHAASASIATTRRSDFLADPNRLNVALTRAQRKLILVGDRQHLATTPLLAGLVSYCAGLYGGRGGIVTARVGGE